MEGGWGGEEVEHHHRQRRISVAGLRLRSRDRGRMTKTQRMSRSAPPDSPPPSPPPPPILNAHLCIMPPTPPATITHTHKLQRQNLICDLSPGDQLRRRSAAVTPPWRSRGGLTGEWGGCWSEERQTVKKEGGGGAGFTTES